MKRLLGYALLLTLVSAPVFAAKNSQSVNLPETVTVGSTQLPAGDYKVSWTGTGSNVQVTFAQSGKKTAATVPAKLSEVKDGHTGFTLDRQGNVNMLETLQLGKVNLVLANAPAAGQ